MAETWAACIAPEKLSKVTALQVREIYKERESTGIAGTTLDLERRTLRAFFAWALELDLIEKNPITRASWPALDRRSGRSRVKVEITPEMFGRVVDIAPVEIRRLLWCLFLTALRIGEALAAEWSWIVETDSGLVLHVPAHIRKQRRDYSVPVGLKLKGILGERGQGKLFPEAPSQRTIHREIARAGRKLGIKGLSPHQFRRSCFTRLLNSGMPILAAQRYAGWSSTPAEFMKMADEHYYLGMDGAEARRIQDQIA